MTEPGDEIRRGDLRFQAQRASLAVWLRALLGAHESAQPLDDAAAAARLHAEYRASERDAERQDWALVRQAWPLADLDEAVDTLHRLSNNLGAREIWLIVPGRDPQACALSSDTVLDNPLGFATLAGHELAILDRQVPAGMSFQRHPPTDDDGQHEWELMVWGEPWLSATTRALRGIG